MRNIGKRDPLIRVAIGDRGNRRSNLGRVAARKIDVYVSTGGVAPAKFSFHESGICRDVAMTRGPGSVSTILGELSWGERHFCPRRIDFSGRAGAKNTDGTRWSIRTDRQ
jgi:hypothetical protein